MNRVIKAGDRFTRVAVLTMGMTVSACGGADPEKFSTALPGDQPMSVPLRAVSPSVLGRIGIAPTPRHFPNHTDQDIRDMIAESSELASVGVLIFQWGDDNLQLVSKNMITIVRDAGLIPVVGLSPTSLAQNRKELDVPAPLRGGVFAKPSFGAAKVRSAFVAESERLARFDLPYLCLGTEINLLALQRMPEFLQFVKAYKEAYRAVKRIAPETKVFVSFAYDFIRVVDNKEPNHVRDHAKLIDIFRPELDLIAITSYPSDFYADPADMPQNYYTHLRKYLKPKDRVLVMEIGWPSSGTGSADEQVRFVDRLPELLADISPVVTAWSLLHDVQLSAFGENLASTGLLTRVGDRKASFDAFIKIKRASDRARP